MGARPPAASTRLAAAGLGVIGGTALQLQQAALWSGAFYAGAALVATLLLLGWWRLGAWGGLGGHHRATLPMLMLGCAVLAFSATGWRADSRLAEALPEGLEGRDLVVVGVIAGLPQRSPEAWRFIFEVESAQWTDPAALAGSAPAAVALPRRLSLGWYAGAQGTQAAGLPALRAGQRWQLTLRLKRPHGARNPHGFDHELYLFEQGLRAIGYVRTVPGAPQTLLAEGVGHPVDRARQAVREAIEARVADPSAAGLLAALAVGDQAAIEREDWALYRDTGVAHLMSISGLHVTMFAWLAGRLINRLWRLSPLAMRRLPAPRAALWGGLLAACAYAVFAGWGVPAQRTALMLAVTTLLGAGGLRWGWPLVWGSAAVVVTLIDPWALLQPGFWLSFVAVGLLMGAGDGQPLARAGSGLGPAAGEALAVGPPASGRALQQRLWGLAGLAQGGLRTQVVATLGLAPLTLVFFQQISPLSFLANLVAIPAVTLLVTPLALLGVLWAPLWSAGAAAAGMLNDFLQALTTLPGAAVWTLPAAPGWAAPCALIGAALVLLPLPGRVRLLGLPLLLPLLAPPLSRPAEGAYELTAVDVGQGTAVLVRTARHTLLYDAGPQYSRESDAGERVLLPLLRALGETRLDALVLSHRDTDHVGGAAALLRGLSVTRVASSLEAGHALLALAQSRGVATSACEAGQAWTWDGVRFEMLHPGADLLARRGLEKTRSNALSCVLRVSGHWGGQAQRALLTGDIERDQEAGLVTAAGEGAASRDALAAEVLIVPHHGSKTSSSEAFIDVVAPRVAVVQAGYRNRFGHPAPPVRARYAARGIELIESPVCGAWRFGPDGSVCWRAVSRRYWHHPGVGEASNGAEVAKPAPPAAQPPATEIETPD
jgi:competence protein ComEC